MAIHSPLQEIFPSFPGEVRVFLKRDDLLHPEIQGNKWRKLAPFIRGMGSNKKGIISFGGPFSNHLHALASAGKLYSFPTIGIVRGLTADIHNPTLSHAQQCGMQVFPVPKRDYEVLKKAGLQELYQYLSLSVAKDFCILPEGGDTIEALVSCRDIAVEIMAQLPQEAGLLRYFCVPAGTGCTASGLIAGATGHAKTLVFPAAAYGVDRNSILEKLSAAGFQNNFDFEIVDGIIPGKFAQMTDELLAFCQAFFENTNILLDPIYTSKMMFKLYAMLSQQLFPPGSCVVALHTGGLQGWAGFNKSVIRT